MHFPSALHCAPFPHLLVAIILAFTPAIQARPHSEAASKPPVNAKRPPELHLTLTRALQLAMQKNLAIKVEAFVPKIADAVVTTEQGMFDPALNTGFEQTTTRTSPSYFESRTTNVSSGISGLTPLGSTYNLGLATGASDYRSFQAGAGFSLTQPLLRGFGTDYNLAGLRIARNARKSSGWVFRQAVIDVVTQTVYAYNAFYSAMRDYDAAVQSRDSALQLQHDEEREMQIGTRTHLDVTTAAADAAAREEAVILAVSTIGDDERALKLLIIDDPKTLLETRVAIEPPPLPIVGPVNVEAGLSDAFLKRPDYQQALLDLKNHHIGIVVARNQALPQIDLNGSLNLLGLNAGDVTSSFGSLGNSSNEPNTWAAGFVFSLPIPNRTARGKFDSAKLAAAQALVRLHQMEQGIMVDVANAAGQINTNRQRIDATREALRLAAESQDAGQARLKAGTATTFEVLQLQEKLATAQAAKIKAEGDYLNAIAEYDRQTGTTLERNGIAVAP